MTFDPLTDLRRLLGDFTGLDFDDETLGAFLTQAAREQASRGLLLQAQEVIELRPGEKSYPLPERWIQTFALLHEDIQTYVALYDQTHRPWYVWVDRGTRELVADDTPPAGVNLTADLVIYWVRWQTPTEATRYLVPEPIGSHVELTIRDTQPPVGTGTTLTLELRQTTRLRWLLGLTDTPEVAYARMADARGHLRAPEAEPTTLTLMAAEGWDRHDRGLPPGPPQYATVWRGRLWVYPTPDAGYQLDHKYFVEPRTGAVTYELPEAFARLPVWQALAWALRSEGRLGPAQSTQALAERLLALTAFVYSPVDHDSRDEFRLPAS